MIVALVAYPLSRDYCQRLEQVLGAVPRYLTVAELRRQSLMALVRQLRGLRAEALLIPLEDHNSRALLPLLCALAAVSDVRRIEIVDTDLRRTPLSRLRALGSLTRSVLASLGGGIAALLCNRELGTLLKSPRIDVQAGKGEIAYLKTNLWFGVKAGGSVGHVSGVINALVRRGYSIRVLAAERPVMIDDSVSFHPIAPPTVYGVPSEFNLYRYQRLFLRQAAALLRRESISMIYQRLSLANYAGVVLSRMLKVPLIIEYNGSEAWVQKNWGSSLKLHSLAVKAEDACLRHAHTVVTISDVLKDELIERGVEPERIATYPNCIEPNVFDPARFSPDSLRVLRGKYGVDADATVVTFIGTFGQWHGVEVFAQAIRNLIDAHRELLQARKAHFLLVGDGLKYAEVHGLLSAPPYAQFVTLTGLVPQNQAPVHLAASDMFVSPHVPNADGSPFFGSPTKLFEYMAMAKPIIASDLNQIGEIFRGSPHVTRLKGQKNLPDGATALLVEPGEAADLAEGIRLLLLNPGWSTQLGQASRKEALTKYTWNHHVNHIMETLEKF